MPDRPNLIDVAAAAGVSKSTAQRALANDSRCAEKTRSKVRGIAEKMGYVPDPVFAAVGARRRSKITRSSAPIAYLHASGTSRYSPGATYLPHCQKRATELGYRLEAIDIAKMESPESLWQVLYAKGFVGVLIGSVRKDFHDILLGNKLFPCVCVGRLDPLPFHTIRSSIQSGVRIAWQKVLERGYKRIGAAVFRHDPMLEDDFARFSYALGSQLTDFPDEEPIPPLVCGFEDQGEFIPWVKRYKPDAVIGFHDGLLAELKDAGYAVPGDIGFASLHCKPPKISGVHENVEMCAFTAVNYLDQIIRHGERGIPHTAVHLVIEDKWIEGRTLRRKNHAKKSRPTAM